MRPLAAEAQWQRGGDQGARPDPEGHGATPAGGERRADARYRLSLRDVAARLETRRAGVLATISPADAGYEREVLQLYQAEWCPHSRKVRQRLTELGMDFVARQVAAEPDDREEMRDTVGEDEIPVLVREDGSTFVGEDEILRWLDGVAAGSAAQEVQHRAKALDKAGLPG